MTPHGIQLDFQYGGGMHVTGAKHNGAGPHHSRPNGGNHSPINKPAARAIEPAADPIKSLPPTPARGRIGRILAAAILGMAGVGLGAIGATATITYSLESTGTLMAALAAAADAIADHAGVGMLPLEIPAAAIGGSRVVHVAGGNQHHRGKCRRLYRFTHRCVPGRARSGVDGTAACA
jgi:hypothetical protein